MDESSSFDSEDIEEMEDDLGINYRNQGFVYSSMIDTYKMKKNERIAAQKEEFDRDEHREKFKRKDRKGGGSTNLDKLKNKPFAMVLPKKAANVREKRDAKVVKKKKMNQLGSFNKRTKDKLESKKKKFK